METDITAMWCTTCGERFTEAQTENVTCCPSCKSAGVPCDPAEDYLIEINWHELRILGIFASNWAHKIASDSAGIISTVRGILSRLERQAPDAMPLSLGGEVRAIRQAISRGELPADRVEARNIPEEGFVVVNGPGAVGYAKRPQS